MIIRYDYYTVHINTDESWLYFNVYPSLKWTDRQGNTGYLYKEKNTDEDIKTFDKDKCLEKLNGSFCWRGVWEGRLYFTDGEYWGEDIQELSELYNDKIIPFCKDFIKKRDDL